MSRTMNDYESFHSISNDMFYKAHQNIYQFIEALKNIQKDAFIKLSSKKQ